ncbi:conserved hypothetical protein [Leishmania major strain Friedlin]|uniref:Uncharacterized protein n=1 Tax=Leishmania major TaxID=5664 RepID=E9AC67_LEIMA|nr:conserved hypothetical protein [Leishmania major strain Friedlin]CAG9567142.1 hypothetical_protein_-_conserved [Leishmania major strain Friedlin]CBZ11881.1 conserved hypothetical protein [Leishmania major strain Friedlin]|eukprot:XP_003721598.1 conserved hypothetical protein [Leishmania major strain Friedlin]
MMSARATASAGAAPRGSRRREPAYYYQSLSAVVDGDVRFGVGCVVLPHARIHVPRGYRLHVDPFCLFEDFAELICDGAADAADQRHVDEAPASPTATAAVALHIGSHNHFHSYARVRCAVATATLASLSSSAAAPPPTWRLMGSGNIFHAFASVQMMLSQPLSSPRGPPAPRLRHFFGDYNVVTTYSSVSLQQGASAAAPLADEGASSSIPSSPAAPRPAASGTFQHVIVFSGEAHTKGADASVARATGALCVPRFGARSVAELPVVIQRITDEAKAGPPPTAEMVGTAAMLERYISDVHPDLRSHEETRIVTEVEHACRCYIHQLLDDGGLQPVEVPC